MPVNSCIHSLQDYKVQSSPKARNGNTMQQRRYLFIIFNFPKRSEKQHNTLAPNTAEEGTCQASTSTIQPHSQATSPMVWEQDWCDHSHKHRRWEVVTILLWAGWLGAVLLTLALSWHWAAPPLYHCLTSSASEHLWKWLLGKGEKYTLTTTLSAPSFHHLQSEKQGARS